MKKSVYSSLDIQPNYGNRAENKKIKYTPIKIEDYTIPYYTKIKKLLELKGCGQPSLVDVVNKILEKKLNKENICVLCNGAKSISVENYDLASSIIKCPICNK